MRFWRKNSNFGELHEKHDFLSIVIIFYVDSICTIFRLIEVAVLLLLSAKNHVKYSKFEKKWYNRWALSFFCG